jgi:hypothetical protein
MKENKFVMGEEEPSTTTTATTTTGAAEKQHNKKQYTRHHVKRRSSGRVHVNKLAPMARVSNNAAHTDTEAEVEDNESNNRPVMRRSQSQRSLHRLSTDRKALTGFTTKRKSSNASIKQSTLENFTAINNSTDNPQPTTTAIIDNKNPVPLSHTAVAAPVEQTFNAVANNLVVPKISSYSTNNNSSNSNEPSINKKQLLKSQFISSTESNSPPKRSNSHENIISNSPLQMTRMSRTQQKLMLQRQQAQIEDETSPFHPKNMQKLNKELELVGREYKCIKRYQDPMKLSLSRCLLLTQQQEQTYIPHLEQRQIIHRHHHLKSIALSRQQQQLQRQPEEQQQDNQDSYGLFSFLDKMFHNKI